MAIQRSTRRKMVLIRTTVFAGILLLSGCGSGTSETKPVDLAANEPMGTEEAKNIYILHCESCHGMDGTKQMSGAADLTKTTKSDAEIRQTILKGNDKGMMPYEAILSEREVSGLVSFVKTFQQK